jgi:hypothetical protein
MPQIFRQWSLVGSSASANGADAGCCRASAASLIGLASLKTASTAQHDPAHRMGDGSIGGDDALGIGGSSPLDAAVGGSPPGFATDMRRADGSAA